jgi:arginyl-tRNA synthetase
MNVLLKTHGIQLSVPTAIQLDCSILKSNSDLFSKNGEPTNAAFVALNLPKERDITVVFDSRALWVYEKVQEHFKDNLMAQVPISICQGLLSSNRDLLDGLLCDAIDLIASESSSDPQSQVAHALGKSFFIIQLLSMRRSKKMQFSNFRLDNQEANLGVYIQYTYSRICGVERNIDEDCKQWDSLDPLTVTPNVFELIQQLDQFDHVLQKSINEPSIMVAYLLQLSKTISSQYYHLRVKGEPLERQKARWAVLSLCKKVLKSGLTLFGLEPVTEI